MYCTSCGHETAAGSRFCVRCGAALAPSLTSSPGPDAGSQDLIKADPVAVVRAPVSPTPVFPTPTKPAAAPLSGHPLPRSQSGGRRNYSRTYAEGKTAFWALFFSFFLPGLGQIYNGDIKKGILMLIAWVAGFFYTFGIVSFMMWIWSMVDACRVANRSIPLWT